MKIVRAWGFAGAALLACGHALAQPVEQQAREALQRQDIPGAIKLLEQAAGKGDIRARAMLADVLLNGRPPQKDPKRACDLVQPVAEAGDSLAEAVAAQCLLMRITPDAKPIEHARQFARASMQQGEPAGAYMVYAAFIMDPANSYIKDGKVDMAAYEALAARPLSARADQVEAFDALGFAAAHGHSNAALSLATYFYETVAPNNVLRLRNVIGAMLKNGEAPPALVQFQQRAGQIVAAGNTKASVRAFADAYQLALPLVEGADKARAGGQACREIRVASIDSGDVQAPEYLPLTSPEMDHTYLVRGHWDEVWKFTGCERSTRVLLRFAADGWGGANITTRVLGDAEGGKP
jgi:TPR repeat protein